MRRGSCPRLPVCPPLHLHKLPPKLTRPERGEAQLAVLQARGHQLPALALLAVCALRRGGALAGTVGNCCAPAVRVEHCVPLPRMPCTATPCWVQVNRPQNHFAHPSPHLEGGAQQVVPHKLGEVGHGPPLVRQLRAACRGNWE